MQDLGDALVGGEVGGGDQQPGQAILTELEQLPKAAPTARLIATTARTAWSSSAVRRLRQRERQLQPQRQRRGRRGIPAVTALRLLRKSDDDVDAALVRARDERALRQVHYRWSGRPGRAAAGPAPAALLAAACADGCGRRGGAVCWPSGTGTSDPVEGPSAPLVALGAVPAQARPPSQRRPTSALRVETSGLPGPDGLYEVWLLDVEQNRRFAWAR